MTSDADRTLSTRLISRHPRDAARVIERYPAPEGAQLLGELPPAESAPLVAAMEAGAAAARVAQLDGPAAEALLGALPPDVAVDLLRSLPAGERSELLGSLSEAARVRLAALLEYADDTAASLADPRAITLPADASIADALEAVREATEGPRDYVFVVEPPARLVGQLSASELIRRDPATRLAEAVEGSPAALSANADIRSVLSHLGWQSRSALPVVDREGRFIGAISVAELQRQFQEPRRQRTGVSTAVSLGELYWLGLAGVLDGLGSVASRSAASSSEQS